MNSVNVAIIGAGRVGATCAYALVMRDLVSDIVLIDTVKNKAKGEVMDISDSIGYSDASNIKVGTYSDVRNADILIVTAGVAQKPGQTRIDLVNINKNIIKDIASNVTLKKDAIVIIVSNPCDILTFYAQKYFKHPRSKIFGSGTILDSQRLRGSISKALKINEESINAYVLGEHGDSQFVAWSKASIGGESLRAFTKIDSNLKKSIEDNVKFKAYDIIKLKGATHFGIGACIATLVENIVFNTRNVFPLSVYDKTNKVCISMPVVLTSKGIEYFPCFTLNKKEKSKYISSVISIKKYL